MRALFRAREEGGQMTAMGANPSVKLTHALQRMTGSNVSAIWLICAKDPPAGNDHMADSPPKTVTATAKKAGTASTTPARKPAPKPAAKPANAKPAAKPLAKAAPKIAPKAAPAAKTAPAPTVVPLKTATVTAVPKVDGAKPAMLKMKDLVDRVVKASGGKKKGVKDIVEATLTALGDAFGKGEAVNLPGFGRAKVAHAEDKGAGKPMTIKMKSQAAGTPKKPGKQPLAEPQE
jgi:nucleoid DNA-binding protein